MGGGKLQQKMFYSNKIPYSIHENAELYRDVFNCRIK